MHPRQIKVGQEYLGRSGRPLPGQEMAEFPISGPDTRFLVVGVEPLTGARGIFTPVNGLTNGQHVCFLALDVHPLIVAAH